MGGKTQIRACYKKQARKKIFRACVPWVKEDEEWEE